MSEMTLRRALHLIFSRRPAISELWLWCTVLASLSYWAELLRESPAIQSPLDPVTVANSIFGAGAFTVAAWCMVATRAARLVPPRPASLSVILVALGVGLLCVIPARQVTGPVLAGMGVRLLLGRQTTSSGRQAGLLLLALGGTWIWARFFTPLQVIAAQIDAHVVGWLMNQAGVDVVVSGNLIVNGDHGIEVLIACSSTFPLPQVVLAFVVVTLYLRGRSLRADLPWLMGSLATSVVLTEIRLVLMALNGDSYQWWHFGPGSSVYEFAALIGACVFPLLAALRQTDPGAKDYRLGQAA